MEVVSLGGDPQARAAVCHHMALVAVVCGAAACTGQAQVPWILIGCKIAVHFPCNPENNR